MDRYLKSVLTVIAIALVWIGVKDFSIISEAIAASGGVEVKVVSMNLNSYQPIPVEIKGEINCRTK
jgi:hypothetical protein